MVLPRKQYTRRISRRPIIPQIRVLGVMRRNLKCTRPTLIQSKSSLFPRGDSCTSERISHFVKNEFINSAAHILFLDLNTGTAKFKTSTNTNAQTQERERTVPSNELNPTLACKKAVSFSSRGCGETHCTQVPP